MAYIYGKNEVNPPTVDSMFGEYKIARLHLTVDAFIDLYPEVSIWELQELNTRFEAWYTELDNRIKEHAKQA